MGSVNEGLSGNTPWTYSKIILLVILNLTSFDDFKNIGASCGAWNSTTLNLLLTVSHHRHFWWWRCRVFLSSWLEERGLKCIRWSAKSEGALLLQSRDYGHWMRAFLDIPNILADWAHRSYLWNISAGIFAQILWQCIPSLRFCHY